MRTIKFNGKNLAVSAAEERALFTLSRNNFAAMKSDFYERRGRYGESILPANKDRRQQLGISYIERLMSLESDSNRVGIRAVHDVDGMTYRNATARERKFFTEQHPRCQSVITGNPRRINAILKALNDRISWQVGWDDENIPSFGLEFFEEESEAQQRAESLYDAGETGIVLTKLEDDLPSMTWELINGDWK